MDAGCPYEFLMRQMLRTLTQHFWAFLLWVQKNPAKFPPNVLQDISVAPKLNASQDNAGRSDFPHFVCNFGPLQAKTRKMLIFLSLCTGKGGVPLLSLPDENAENAEKSGNADGKIYWEPPDVVWPQLVFGGSTSPPIVIGGPFPQAKPLPSPPSPSLFPTTPLGSFCKAPGGRRPRLVGGRGPRAQGGGGGGGLQAALGARPIWGFAKRKRGKCG